MRKREQGRLGSGFAARSEPAQILEGVDLSGRLAVVTGGYSGIGLETTRALAAWGAVVIVPARNEEKARHAVSAFEGEIVIGSMDLADLSSVGDFVASTAATYPRIDLLINNAGIMACPQERLGPGWESQFAVNHLGHAALTQGLIPQLLAADSPRVVCLSSVGHRRSDILWDDPHFRDAPYDKWVAYGQAKTANALYARALDIQFAEQGLSAYSVHPGGILTDLQRHLASDEMQALGWIDEHGDMSEAAARIFKTPAQGCTTTLWAATSPMLTAIGGVYCEDCDIADVCSPEVPSYKGAAAHITDNEAAMRLWDMTQQMLGD